MRKPTKSGKNGKEIMVIDVSQVKDWNEHLKEIPDITMGDVMVYMLSTCQWSEDRLRSFKQDNGYKLFQNNHISDVRLSKTEEDFFYIRGKCIPETSQSSDPYSTWILIHLDTSNQEAVIVLRT